MDSLQSTEALSASPAVPENSENEPTILTRIMVVMRLPLVAMGTGLLLWFGLTRLPVEMGTTPYVGVGLQLILMAYVSAMIWLFTRPLSSLLRTNAILLLLGIFFLAILTLKLKNTEFTVGGINGDARFYTTYITKLATYPGYGDMFYKDLPSFYPPLYYFVVGRVADWFSLEPFRVMKPALFVTVMLLPLITGALWRRLVDERFVAAVTLGMLVFPDWFKPNEWLALACFVPWWLHWVDNSTGYRPATGRDHLWWWLGGGLIGALIFQLYFFWLFVGGVTLLVRAGWWLFLRRDDEQLRASIINAFLMLGVTALLSSPFWAPYLYSMLETGGWQPLQNRFFSDSKIPLPLDFLQNTWQAVVYLGGLAYLVLGAGGDRVARGLLWLVIGFFVWVAIGYVGVLAHTPLLTFRSYPVLTYLLGAGAFLGLFRFWHGDFVLRELAEAIFPWRRLATLLLILVVLLFANSVIVELQSQENVQDAVDATYPTDELAVFDRLTAGEYEDRVILVTDRYRSILFFRPIYSFLAWSAHFSHPAGRFHDRVDFLTKAAQLHDPAIFAAAMQRNRYDAVDYLLLRPENQFWHYQFVDDNFPNRTLDREIYFPDQLLVEPYWIARTEASYTLFQAGDTSPVLALLASADSATEAEAPLAVVAQLYTWLTLFNDHLALADHQALQQAAQDRLATADVTRLPVATLLDLRQVATGRLAAKVDAALAVRLALPTPVTLVDDSGTAHVRLLGYQVQSAATADGVTLNLYLEALAPISEAYTVWLHAFGPDGEKLIFDHAPPLATTQWVPGRVYRDQVTLTVPPARYQLDVGLWQPELDQRLWNNGTPGVTLGTPTLPPPPPITRPSDQSNYSPHPHPRPLPDIREGRWGALWAPPLLAGEAGRRCLSSYRPNDQATKRPNDQTTRIGTNQMNYAAVEEAILGGTTQRRGETVIVRGEGCWLFDTQGKRYLDLTAAQGVAMLGHSHPKLSAALAAQAHQLIACPNFLYNQTRAEFAEALAAVLPAHLNHVFLANSGAEAIDGAIKFARLTTGRTGLVATMRGFHGRTVGAVSLTWEPKYRKPFEPLLDVSHVPYNNLEKIDAVITDETAMVLLEVIQGEGGVNLGDPDYLCAVQQLCHDRGALLVIDEIQTGFGRTGKWFGHQHIGLQPDIICMAKGIGGGFPMGALAYTEQVHGALNPGSHGSTFGGSPIASAAGLAALRIYEEEGIIERSAQMGELLRNRLQATIGDRLIVREIRGLGLMIAIELREKVGPYLKTLMDDHGVIALPAGANVLRLLPPLIITEEEIEIGVNAIAAVLPA